MSRNNKKNRSGGKNTRNTYNSPGNYNGGSKKSLVLRIFIVIVAVVMILSFVILPIVVDAEEKGRNITVKSFETGSLDKAIADAADGTDYNYIINVAVRSGTLNEDDYAALMAIPNLEILELAGTETENGIIPENALTSRNQLSLVTLPKNTVEIGKNAFSSNRKLIKVYMPATVKKIDDYAFAYCEAMTYIPVSESVTYIGEGAFQDCKAITEFVIPAGITEIYPNTFSKCGFESISIGPNVESIGMSVFADCNNLKDIYVYGETAPDLAGDVFRNVSATIHCYDGSKKSYASWEQNNIKVVSDLTGEYSLKADIPEDNGEAYEEDVSGDEPEDETEEAGEEPVETEETEAKTQSREQMMGTVNDVVNEDGTPVDFGASQKSGGLSVGVVVVIVIMAVVIAILATVLVFVLKVLPKNKQ